MEERKRELTMLNSIFRQTPETETCLCIFSSAETWSIFAKNIEVAGIKHTAK